MARSCGHCAHTRRSTTRTKTRNTHERDVAQDVQGEAQATPGQARALDEVLWRCRDLYNTGLEQRITAYQRYHVSVSRYEQEAELKVIGADFPEYTAIHSHVLQDVLARLDKTYQAFFRRIQRGEKAGFPRFKGRNRFHSFTYKSTATARGWTMATSFYPRLGASGCSGVVPLKGHLRPSLSRKKPMAGMWQSLVRKYRYKDSHPLERRRG
jgi:transposase